MNRKPVIVSRRAHRDSQSVLPDTDFERFFNGEKILFLGGGPAVLAN